VARLTSGGQVVCERCGIADAPLARVKGLLGRSDLSPGDGLLIRPTWSIHTAFMRFPIDVVFVGSDLRVLAIRENVRPWRAVWRRGAHAALELPAGEARRRRLAEGDELRLE
jgi:uncharacterized membrane protein (UPF0127 family)